MPSEELNFNDNDYHISAQYQQQSILPKIRASNSTSAGSRRPTPTAVPATPRMLKNSSGNFQQQPTQQTNQTYKEEDPTFAQYDGATNTPQSTNSHYREQYQTQQNSGNNHVADSQSHHTLNSHQFQSSTGETPSKTPTQSRLLPPAALDQRQQQQVQQPQKIQLPPLQVDRSTSNGQRKQQSNQFHRRSIGEWDFMRTIGAGSMGKVKLAKHRRTGEICAIKIVPRAAKVYLRAHANDPPASTPEEAQKREKEFEKEIARDKRTIRETSLGKILYHPFICRLFEVITMSNHYYMLFEYVSGGQMLDYIVSHGSLKERHARKFARGIGSALDYLHKNNVVHRDLKIENIMISKSGDIKIIDFGLSNMYSNDLLLKTYCGSLYFAAPELLSAHPYIGPEVDVWSFGVVLFVLVCGRVPFDDQSVSVLHEKIKKGKIDYPNFLSPEVTSLLKRMLVVNPNKRATLSEILTHPWMTKGYEGPLLSLIPHRFPLTLPLDPLIIHEMHNLEFGSSEDQITQELTAVVSSNVYAEASQKWFKVQENKSHIPSSEVNPTSGFHPLVSIYYLVDEMVKRKKAKQSIVDIPISISDISQPSISVVETDSNAKVQTSKEQPQTSAITPVPAPVLTFPEQAHTSPTSTSQQQGPQLLSSNTAADESLAHQQVQRSNKDDNKGFNSLLRKFSKRRTNSERRPNIEHVSPTIATSNEQHRVDTYSPHKARFEGFGPASVRDQDNLVRRVGSLKITRNSPFDPSDVEIKEEKPQTLQVPLSQAPNKSHNRAVSAYTGPSEKIAEDKILEPSSGQSAVTQRKFHPSARAKSVGHSHQNNHRSNTPIPPLPTDINDDVFFDDVNIADYLSPTSVKDGAPSSSKDERNAPIDKDQESEKLDRSPQGSMPSIEYPRTLFLKGFFSVQTTSNKPLTAIRANIISVLTKNGIQFTEVRGGFVCIHTPSIETSKTEKTITLNNNDNAEDASLKSSGSYTIQNENSKGQAFEKDNTSLGDNSLDQQSTPSSKSSAHKRKFSIGGSILGYRRKQSGGAPPIPPTPTATSGYNHHNDASNNDLDSSASLDSFSAGRGGSDMLISSRIEQNKARASSNHDNTADDDEAQHQKSQNQSLATDKEGKKIAYGRSPLKFEIHVVKVPLVGLYGVQFKKVLGNTWLYKALAEQILNELNL
ncbi:hypothetical protein WICMUC_004521 [Wickerhamomyces mucosus]|uniref:non-specific serine/threonine protein kinase n=1 Tax=Wickerhamomyces mucosus TaxID=1378264 RepID=A0A9P8PIP6_9ASCO|nr:hypothetical protein WICMUC_004521 [Wickerhamomyces mucosus]